MAKERDGMLKKMVADQQETDQRASHQSNVFFYAHFAIWT